jgi:hypothetical protein
MLQTKNKILGFKKLPIGWHYGQGVSPLQSTIDKALQLHQKASDSGFRETDAFPGINGEIQVTLYQNQTYLEFTINDDQSITYVKEEGDQEVEYKENLSINDAISIIQSNKSKLEERECPTFELSVASTMTNEESGFLVLPLNHLVTEPVYRCSESNAQNKQVVVFARTSAGTIEKWQEIRQYTGYSTLPDSRSIKTTSANNQAVREMFAIIT